MNHLQLDWDTENVSPENQFDALPAGSALAMVDNIEPKETKTGGMMFVLTHTLLDGPYAGRKLFHNANIKNLNPKAEQIGREQIAQIQAATGCHGSKNLSDVMNKPMVIKWNKKSDPQYGDQNNITSWKQSTVGGQQTTHQAADNTPAWAR